jgi:hypothetical protein
MTASGKPASRWLRGMAFTTTKSTKFTKAEELGKYNKLNLLFFVLFASFVVKKLYDL